MRNLSHAVCVCCGCVPDVTGTVMTGNDLITDGFYLSSSKELHVMVIMSCNLEIRTPEHLDLLPRLLSALPLPFIYLFFLKSL